MGVRRLWRVAECWISAQQAVSRADKEIPSIPTFPHHVGGRKAHHPSVRILRAMRENSRVHTEHFSSISLQDMIFTILAFEKKVF